MEVLTMVNRFSNKNTIITYEGAEFEVKRPNIYILSDVVALITETGLLDVFVGGLAVRESGTDEEKARVAEDLGKGAISKLQNSVGDIRDRFANIIADLAGLSEEEKRDIPIDFAIEVITAALKTVDGQAFLTTFQTLSQTASEKFQEAQAKQIQN